MLNSNVADEEGAGGKVQDEKVQEASSRSLGERSNHKLCSGRPLSFLPCLSRSLFVT